ncbi:MAG TPA: GNAT family N-acetyltransferase [Clostridia bacterium]|nr:GNAT family N-acetyltransferase [Clostridia bacterium]
MKNNRIIFLKAGSEYLTDCSKILENTTLGQKYFLDSTGEYIGKKLLEEGFEKEEIYISFDKNNKNQIIGFSWIQARGIFNWFPYLHVVAIAKENQGKGYGKKHMAHFESMCQEVFKASKGFLVVGKYNTKAIELYKKIGYQMVGSLPNLFVNGLDELFMYKEM